MPPPATVWHDLLRPDVELSAAYWESLAARMREAKLTFGGRLNCPFLRPFFLHNTEETRVRSVAETMAALGERVAEVALTTPPLLACLGLTDEEERLARIDPGYATASTASRLDAFLLPDSLQFAEYNAESPAGLAYSERLAEVFSDLEITRRFRATFDFEVHPLMERLLEALLASYRDWGGTTPSPLVAIVDWREVPTWNEFEILQHRFETQGVRTIVADPRDLEFDGRSLTANAQRIDLVYRRVLMTDIVARPVECEALVRAYSAKAVCMANTLRCKLPHKKAFFAVLTDERFNTFFSAHEQQVIAQHVPWTRVLRDEKTTYQGRNVDLVALIREHRDRYVIKPNDEYGGSGVMLGWETDQGAWDNAIETAISQPRRVLLVQEKIAVRREVFPLVSSNSESHRVDFRDMLVDFAPYLFRGKLAGYLTRLSATGLANVTSGGGQVPVFVVKPRETSERQT